MALIATPKVDLWPPYAYAHMCTHTYTCIHGHTGMASLGCQLDYVWNELNPGGWVHL